MTQLAPHQQRVLAEKAELDERRAKLAAFTNGPIFGDLPEPERLHLNEQQRVMAEYSSILGARIAMFGVADLKAPKAAPITLPVIDPGLDALEREIAAKASNGPRVTPWDVEVEIAREHFFTAEQGASHGNAVAKPYDFGDAWASSRLDAVTFCVLVLRNGTKVVGVNYGAIDPAQHSAERGRQEARAQAVDKVYELLGFRLRDELARPVLTDADAAADLAGTPRSDNPSTGL